MYPDNVIAWVEVNFEFKFLNKLSPTQRIEFARHLNHWNTFLNMHGFVITEKITDTSYTLIYKMYGK